jgi:hypothetical protein
MKPTLELPSKYRSEKQFHIEVWTLLAKRGFYILGGRVVHLTAGADQETKLIEVTPEYLADYINGEFQPFQARKG